MNDDYYSNNNQDGDGQNPYGQDPYGPQSNDPYHDNQYDQNQYDQNQHDQNQYDQNQYQQPYNQGPPPVEDKPTTILNLVSCCFPLVGLILYIVWRNEKPLSAKSVGKWAIIGVVIGVVINILFAVLGVFTMMIPGALIY